MKSLVLFVSLSWTMVFATAEGAPCETAVCVGRTVKYYERSSQSFQQAVVILVGRRSGQSCIKMSMPDFERLQDFEKCVLGEMPWQASDGPKTPDWQPKVIFLPFQQISFNVNSVPEAGVFIYDEVLYRNSLIATVIEISPDLKNLRLQTTNAIGGSKTFFAKPKEVSPSVRQLCRFSANQTVQIQNLNGRVLKIFRNGLMQICTSEFAGFCFSDKLVSALDAQGRCVQ